MSRMTYFYKARIPDALENAIEHYAQTHDCDRGEAGRQLMALGAKIGSQGTVVIRPHWSDGSLLAVDKLVRASSDLCKAARALKRPAVDDLGDDMERRKVVGGLTDQTYDTYRQMDSLRQTLLSLTADDIVELRRIKPELEIRSVEGDRVAAWVFRLIMDLGI